MNTYTILFSLESSHFQIANIQMNEERQFSCVYGDFTATMKQVTQEPTAEHTGTGFVRIKSLRTSFDEVLVCTIAKKK